MLDSSFAAIVPMVCVTLAALAAMVADVRNPAALLLVDHRMVAAARLQIVVAQQAHVPDLRLPAFLGQCRRRTGREPRNSTHRGR